MLSQKREKQIWSGQNPCPCNIAPGRETYRSLRGSNPLHWNRYRVAPPAKRVRRWSRGSGGKGDSSFEPFCSVKGGYLLIPTLKKKKGGKSYLVIQTFYPRVLGKGIMQQSFNFWIVMGFDVLGIIGRLRCQEHAGPEDAEAVLIETEAIPGWSRIGHDQVHEVEGMISQLDARDAGDKACCERLLSIVEGAAQEIEEGGLDVFVHKCARHHIFKGRACSTLVPDIKGLGMQTRPRHKITVALQIESCGTSNTACIRQTNKSTTSCALQTPIQVPPDACFPFQSIN